MIRILLILAFVMLTSCATKHGIQIEQFVDSSKQYLDASDLLLKQAKETEFANNHTAVDSSRNRWGALNVDSAVDKRSNDVSVYYLLISELRQQRSLLYSYFSSLTNIAEPKQSSSSMGSKISWWLRTRVSDESEESFKEDPSILPQKIANELILVNRKIETLQINGQRIESMVEHDSAVFIARLGNEALENELRQRETMIRYALSLHKAGIQVIAKKLNDELGKLARQKEVLRQKIEQLVENPYNDPDYNLGHCWAANRQMLLEEFTGIEDKRRDTAKAASLAEEGAHYMQRAFYAVLEGQRNIYEVSLLNVKTKELSAMLANSQGSTLSILPEGCQDLIVSIEQVQAVPVVAAPSEPIVKRVSVPVVAIPVAKKRFVPSYVHLQKEYAVKEMRVWAKGQSYGPIKKGDTLYSIAKNMRVDDRYSVAQIMAALFKKNTPSFNFKKLGLLKLGETLVAPTSKEVEKLTSKQARTFVKRNQ